MVETGFRYFYVLRTRLGQHACERLYRADFSSSAHAPRGAAGFSASANAKMVPHGEPS